MSYTLTTNVQTDAPGQTLSAQLIDTTGATVGAAVTSGFVDIGGGFYLWTYAAYPDGFRGGVKFSVAGVLKTVVGINPQEGENTDTKTSSRADASVYTSARATRLDHLDVDVSSRFDASDSRLAHLDADISSRLAASGYTAPPGTAAIVAAILDELLAGHATAGSVGATLALLDVAVSSRVATSDTRMARLDAAVSSRLATADGRLAHLDVDVSSRVATSDSRLAHLDVDVSSREPAGGGGGGGGGGGATVAEIVAGVLDELVANHPDVGSVGAALAQLDANITSRVSAASYVPPNNAGIATAVATGTANATALSTLQTAVTAIKSVTDRIPFITGTGELVARLSSEGASDVWKVLTSSLGAAGTIGRRLVDLLDVAVSTRAAASDLQDLVIDVSQVNDPLNRPVPGGYPAGSAGAALGEVADMFRTSPLVLDRETIAIVRGTDYTGDNAISLTNLAWPDLTGAVVQMRTQLGTHYLNKTLAVLAPRLVALALTSSETGALEPGQYVGELHASLADGSSVSLQRVVADATYAAP